MKSRRREYVIRPPKLVPLRVTRLPVLRVEKIEVRVTAEDGEEARAPRPAVRSGVILPPRVQPTEIRVRERMRIERGESRIRGFSRVRPLKPPTVEKREIRVPLKAERVEERVREVKPTVSVTPPRLQVKGIPESLVPTSVERAEELQLEMLKLPEPGSPELPVIPDVLLSPESEGGSLGDVWPEGPIYVVVEEPLYRMVAHLCAVVHRIKSPEGPPRFRIEDEYLELMPVPKRREDVYVVRSDELRERIEDFERRFTEFSVEPMFRFIVIVAKDYEDLEGVLPMIRDPTLGKFIPELLVYRLKRGLSASALDLLMRACWGFIELKPSPREGTAPPPVTLILSFYNNYYNEFRRKLKRIVEDLGKRWPIELQPKLSPERESPLHYALKYLVVNHLHENEGIAMKDIETEEELGYARPDVYVKTRDREIAVEIETLYRKGSPRLGVKLRDEVLEKYFPNNFRPNKFKGELWLVIPNLHALLFCDEIVKVVKDYRKKGCNVHVYLLDLTGKGHEIRSGRKASPGLIRLEDVVEILRAHGLRREVRWLAEVAR